MSTGEKDNSRRWWPAAISWLPVVLLLIGVANHLWLVKRHQLSPWLGAGFGMFSTTDVGSTRQVYLTTALADGSEYWVELDEPYRDTLLRARALPTDDWLARLSEATFQALEDDASVTFPAEPLTLRIEIWRNSYAPETLRPTAERLARGIFPFPDDFGS